MIRNQNILLAPIFKSFKIFSWDSYILKIKGHESAENMSAQDNLLNHDLKLLGTSRTYAVYKNYYITAHRSPLERITTLV